MASFVRDSTWQLEVGLVEPYRDRSRRNDQNPVCSEPNDDTFCGMDSALPPVLQTPLSPTVGLLLESRIPARIAWVAQDNTPRVLPIWFVWTGTELVVVTFEGAKKLHDLTDGTVVAVTIDTDDFPYRSLKLRGTVTAQPTSGIADRYKEAAVRYLGEDMAQKWLSFLCLLYTSPSPRDQRGSRMPSSA